LNPLTGPAFPSAARPAAVPHPPHSHRVQALGCSALELDPDFVPVLLSSAADRCAAHDLFSCTFAPDHDSIANSSVNHLFWVRWWIKIPTATIWIVIAGSS
jgi:hypothetical protein